MTFDDAALTRDNFLNGQVQAWQPKNGYRAGVDPVLMAATVPAFSGQSVLELGCGVGVASLCLAARVSGLSVTGIELQADYADLARRNAAANGVDMTVHCTDLRDLPAVVTQATYDHVIANPPYYLREGGTAAADAGRETALGEQTPLADWIAVATRRLKPKGFLTVIQNAERLPEVLALMDSRLGDVKVLPLAARVGRAAHLCVVQARKGARAPFQMLAPVVMHEGAVHDGDRESYTAQIRAVLRDGANLPLIAPVKGS